MDSNPWILILWILILWILILWILNLKPVQNRFIFLQVGQKIEVVLDAILKQSFGGQVTHLDRVYEEKRGDTTYTATLALDQMYPQMRWGMTAAVQFLP